MGYYENLYQKEMIERSDKFEHVDFEYGDLENVFSDVVSIEIPGSDATLKEMTGSSLGHTIRKEPITAQVNLRNVLKTSSEVIAGIAVTNAYIKGLILLLIFSSIALPKEESIRTEQALTYGMAWKSSEEGILPIKKDLLIKMVSEKSNDMEEIHEMTEADVVRCVNELSQMECITTESTSDGTLIWLNEEFNVEYQL